MPKQLANPYRSTFNTGDFMAGDVITIAGKFVELGRKVAVAGQGIALGYGALAGQDSAIGRIYMKLIDDTAGNATFEEGLIRIELRNPQDRPIKTVFEARTENLRTQIAAPSFDNMVVFPMMADVVTEDFQIVILIRADAADTIAKAYSVFGIDYTNFDTMG